MAHYVVLLLLILINIMKDIFETFSYFIPTIILLGLLYLIVTFYFLVRNYIFIKKKYYKLKIEELEKNNENKKI
ncbi:MAG: hypothetical protein RI980_196 [Bacteroidota bacterium]|jgi:hypothetical protein